MAESKYRQALMKSLNTEEERKFIQKGDGLAHADWVKSYRNGILGLIDNFDRTRLWPHQKDNIQHRFDKLGKRKPVSGFITTLPAGSGKTEIFMNAVLSTAKEVTDGGRVKLITPPTVILVPSEDLVEDTYKDIVERSPNLLIGREYGKVKEHMPLSPNDMKELPRGRHTPVQQVIDELIESYDSKEKGKQRIECDGLVVELQQMLSSGNQPICIAKADWETILQIVDKRQQDMENWLSMSDTKKMPSGGFLAIYNKVREIIGLYDDKKAGIQSVEYNGQVILLKKLLSRPRTPVAIARDDWDKVLAAAQVETQETKTHKKNWFKIHCPRQPSHPNPLWLGAWYRFKRRIAAISPKPSDSHWF